MIKLTTEEIQAKSDQLSKNLGVKVNPLVFVEEESGEQIIGYVKEPNRITKVRILDKAMSSPMTAGSDLLDIILIKEESDPRISSENQDFDKYYLGAVMAAMGMIKYSQDTFKKK